MLKVFAAVLLASAGSPDYECGYFSATGQSLRFMDDVGYLVFDAGASGQVTCAVAPQPDETGWTSVDCGTWTGRFLVGSSVMGSGDADLIIFQSAIFYRSCPSRS